MKKPVTNTKKNSKRSDQWTICCPQSLKDFASARAKELGMRSASELVQRLIVAESESKRGIAERHSRILKNGEAAA